MRIRWIGMCAGWMVCAGLVQAQTGQAQHRSRPVAKPPVAVPAEAPAKPSLGAEEMAIADRVHVGKLPCELGTVVVLQSDARQPGYFHLQVQGRQYHMQPVVSRTGAIRLEDPKAGAVWLQLANKSMLMDQKLGRRVADECAHPEQMAVAQGMKTNPPPNLLETAGPNR